MPGTLFTQRHYRAIAAVLRSECPHPDTGGEEIIGWLAMRRRLSDLFEADNEKFKPELFRRECER